MEVKTRLALRDCDGAFDFSVLVKVKMSLDSVMDSLVSLSDIGDCVARVEHLLKELKSLEKKAQVGPGSTYLTTPKSKRLRHKDV